MLILSTNVDKKLLKTEFLIDISRLTGDKSLFDPRSFIVKGVFDDCRRSISVKI